MTIRNIEENTYFLLTITFFRRRIIKFDIDIIIKYLLVIIINQL